jgi:pimeloyl-ACP methyl ester carboxylesterase
LGARPVLVPSPFVSARSWAAMAKVLPGAVVADYGVVEGPDWYGRVAAEVARQAPDEPWVAVMHSGAGGFAPELAAASERLAGLIFVDAVLPYPGQSCLSTAPTPLVAALRRVTEDGVLKPWNQWFETDPAKALIPDAELRRAFAAELPRVPFAFLEAVAPDRRQWERLPTAYVQLSEAYAKTAEKAEARGWTVRRSRMHHLAMLSDPEAVAGLIAEFL